MCTPYVFIDDSTDQAHEEEEFYQEEEEENFNHCTAQGKPSLTMQANPWKLDNLSKCIRHALVIPFDLYLLQVLFTIFTFFTKVSYLFIDSIKSINLDLSS